MAGWVGVRSRLRADLQEPNRTTRLDFHLDESAPAVGVAGRAGVLWHMPRGGSMMLGLAYVHARGSTEFRPTTPLETYSIELQPRYDSVGLAVDGVVNRYFGLDATFGTGRMRGAASSDFDETRGGDRNGYLMALGFRARLPLSEVVALSLGLEYQVLGFFPRLPNARGWNSGDLFTAQLGLDFDWSWNHEAQP